MSAEQVDGVLLLGLTELFPHDLLQNREENGVTKRQALQIQLDSLEVKINNLLAAIESGSSSVAARLTQLESERASLKKKQEIARMTELSTLLPENSLNTLRSTKLADLLIPEQRERISAEIHRIITRIDIGRSFADLPLSDKFTGSFIRSAKEGLSFRPVGVPDTTSSKRPKKPIVMLVTFATGAQRLIARGQLPDMDGQIITYRPPPETESSC